MKNKFKILLVFVLAVLSVISFMGYSYAIEVGSNTFETENYEGELTEIKDVIEYYFDTYYKSLLGQQVKYDSFNKVLYKDFFNYIVGKANYIVQSYKGDNTKLLDYEILITYDKFDIFNNEAIVELRAKKIMEFNYLNESFEDIEEHKISLIKDKTKWLIKDDISSNLFDMTYDINTDFDKLAESIEAEYKTYRELCDIEATEIKDINELLDITDEWDRYTYSKRDDSVYYALKYTDNSGTIDSSSYNTSQFKVYADTDCQNYVSQCLWYGFGGRSSSRRDYPMNNSWWANTSGEARTWNWTGTSYFKDYITYNDSYDDYGIQGTEYRTPSNIDIGDYVYVPGHVMFITDITGSGTPQWENIYISAHTNNRRDKNLKSLYNGVSTPPSNMRFMRIWGIKNYPIG